MIRKILPFLSMLLLLSCQSQPKQETALRTRYLASQTADVVLYDVDTAQVLVAADTMVRGTQVTIDSLASILQQEVRYFPIVSAQKVLYVAEENAVYVLRDVVQEKHITLRSTIAIIDDTVTSHISGQTRAGEPYEVLDYDYIFPDGNVHRYKIRTPHAEGYIYGRYREGVREKQLALNYDSIHARVRNPFGGGLASGCDYQPVEKPNFPNNPMPDACYSLYLNISPAVIGKIDEYIALAKQTKINSFVLDIKDNECPGYKAEAMEKYSPTNYKWAGRNKEAMYEYAVRRLREEGFYVVGRITCFKDSYFVKDHPECAITNRVTGEPFFHNKAYWPSAYNRQVWQFNVELAKEAVRKFGFNEINFDYVRFPDKMQSVEDSIDYQNRYGESKVQAIQRFVQYACDELHELETYVSIDVFGESANKGYTTPYGQYWPAISNVADVICGMPYPDHFASGYGGIKAPWNNPYLTMKTWGKSVQSRQSEIPTPARVRTWIQAYPVMRHVDPNGIRYNADELAQEIRGLYDAGLTDGYITWLSSSSLSRYTSQATAFMIDYLNDTISTPADFEPLVVDSTGISQ